MITLVVFLFGVEAALAYAAPGGDDLWQS